jgi:hypothetical protein
MQNSLNFENQLRWDFNKLYNENLNYNYKLFFAKEINNLKQNFFYGDSGYEAIKPVLQVIDRFNRTKNLEESDYVFVPHPWVLIKKNFDYLRYLNELSLKVPLLICNTDDTSPKCDLPNTLEIRTFLHPKEKIHRKIVFPYPAKSKNFTSRTWRDVPQISFIGYVPKLTLGTLTSKSISFLHSPFKSSVYLNRKITVAKLNRLQSQFKVVNIKRNKFTLSLNNLSLLSDQATFDSNLMESDYIICPRGFGNTSIRFYETLSSGATPVLVDSGSPLPVVSNDNFWNDNIVKLGLFANWSSIISADWNNLRFGDNYINRQIENNKMFSKELEIQKYTELIFEKYIF